MHSTPTLDPPQLVNDVQHTSMLYGTCCHGLFLGNWYQFFVFDMFDVFVFIFLSYHVWLFLFLADSFGKVVCSVLAVVVIAINLYFVVLYIQDLHLVLKILVILVMLLYLGFVFYLVSMEAYDGHILVVCEWCDWCQTFTGKESFNTLHVQVLLYFLYWYLSRILVYVYMCMKFIAYVQLSGQPSYTYDKLQEIYCASLSSSPNVTSILDWPSFSICISCYKCVWSSQYMCSYLDWPFYAHSMQLL